MEEIPRTFLIVGPVWLLTSCEWPASIEQHCRSIHRLRTKEKPTGDHDFIAAFTDADLAERHVRRLPDRDRLTTVRVPIPGPFARTLQMLLDYGDTHIGFDPEETDADGKEKCNVFEIPVILQSIQYRPKKENPDDLDPGIR